MAEGNTILAAAVESAISHENMAPSPSPSSASSNAVATEHVPSAGSAENVSTVLRMSTRWSDFVDDKIGRGEWSKTRRAELAGTLRLVIRLAGDIPLVTLTREQATEIRSRFFKLPADHKNLWFDREVMRERTFDQLVAHVATLERNKPVKRVTAKTWNRQAGTLSSYILWLKSTSDAAQEVHNAFAGLMMPSSNRRRLFASSAG